MCAVNFISYLRVSTARQGQFGLGIEAQREAVRRYVESVGGNLLEEHVEVETGRSSTRPILLQSIARCRSARATLVIAKLDRLARSVSFISSLMEGGVEFVATDMPQATKMMLQMLAVFAEFERDQIAARTKAALAAAKARGVILGSHGKILAAAHRADAGAFAAGMENAVRDALNHGARTLQEVADQLNSRGHTSREGALWSPSSVQRIMRRQGIFTVAMRNPETM